MKALKSIGIVLVIGIGLAGCLNDVQDNGNPQTTKNPGKFSATVLSDTFGSRSAARGVSLGTYTVANSKNIYFLLRNVGDFPITGIKLTAGKLIADGGTFVPITDNGIAASPGSITVLETSGKAMVEAIIEVAINHGNIAGLISQQYVQKADFAGTTIRITGITTDEDDNAVDVSLDVDIETLIKVCSFEVHYSVNNGATYVKAKYESKGGTGFEVPAEAMVKLYNSGNVPLRYKYYMKDGKESSWELNNVWITLNADTFSEQLTRSRFDLPGGGSGVLDYIPFIIDTQGIAFDSNGIEELISPNSSIIRGNGFIRIGPAQY